MRFVCLFFIFLVLVVSTVSVVHAQSPSTTLHKIEVSKSGFFIDGTAVKLPIRESDLNKILGTPDKTFEGVQTVKTWESLGLIGYQKTGSEEFLEIGVVLDIKENVFDFTPSSPFVGILTVDGAKVTARSTRDSVNKGKKGKKFKPLPLVQILSELETGGFYLVMWQTEKSRKPGSAKILEIAISIPEK